MVKEPSLASWQALAAPKRRQVPAGGVCAAAATSTVFSSRGSSAPIRASDDIADSLSERVHRGVCVTGITESAWPSRPPRSASSREHRPMDNVRRCACASIYYKRSTISLSSSRGRRAGGSYSAGRAGKFGAAEPGGARAGGGPARSTRTRGRVPCAAAPPSVPRARARDPRHAS